MNSAARTQNERKFTTKNVVKLIILVLTCLASFGFLVLPDILDNTNQVVGAGEVAPQEILAPYSITFESKVLTERARSDASVAVDPVYLPSDPNIARTQLEKLNNALDYISIIRKDELGSSEQKLADLKALDALKLTDLEYQKILELNDEDWQKIDAEANQALESVLRESLRNDQIGRAKSNLPAMLDFSLRTDQSQLIVSIVSPLIVPTSLFSEEQTQLFRDQARAAVDPISRQIMAGEVLVRRGQVVREEDLEALNAFGLSDPANQTDAMIKSSILVTVCGIVIALYFKRRNDPYFDHIKAVAMVAVFFLIFLGLARFLVMDRTVLPYLYPMAAFGLTVAIVFRLEFGIVSGIILSSLMVFGLSRDFELVIFYLIPLLTGMLIIGKARRISAFLLSGFFIALTGAAIVIAFRWSDGYTDLLGYTTLISSAIFNGFASATLALLLQMIFSYILDLPTAIQLMDISRPDHPLMQMILSNAPGSYQHSLQVSNLAEQAAEAIGADRLLVRVGTLFHDVGKAGNPAYFIENQVRDQIDSHESVSPEEAAATIIQHVHDGAALAKKYRLPSRVIDFIREHHGTMITRYQYSKALEQAEKPEDINLDLFRYPGPTPRSKETALLMLADGTEARARANSPKTDDEIHEVIENVVNTYQSAGQLDNTDLTLRDLETIKDSFFQTLKRSYHPRLQYPDAKPVASGGQQNEATQQNKAIKE